MSFEPPPLPQNFPPEIPQPAPAPLERPTSVMVFGVIFIVSGGLTMLCSPFALMTPFINSQLRDGASPAFHAFSVVSIIIGLLLAAWKLTSGIGLVRSRPWARTCAVGFAAAAIVFQLVNAPISFILISNNQSVFGDPALRKLGICIGLFGSLMWTAFYFLILFFLTRPNVKAYFASRA